MVIEFGCPQVLEHVPLEILCEHAFPVISVVRSVLSEGPAELDDVEDVELICLGDQVLLPVFEHGRRATVHPPVASDGTHGIPARYVLLSHHLFIVGAFDQTEVRLQLQHEFRIVLLLLPHMVEHVGPFIDRNISLTAVL